MFKKLRNRIITVTMAIATVILVLSGMAIMLFSTRPEPPHPEGHDALSITIYDNQELKDYIKIDRQEGNQRLLFTLLYVGVIIEIVVFLITYYASQKIVEPVKNSYNNQKIFIANASHELKTPLAVIQANMEALDVDESSQKWKENIETEITHANKLVLDLLQLAKMDANSIRRSPIKKTNLAAEIEKRITMFQPKFSGRISFESTAEPKAQPLPKQDFLQVLDILLDNATKYGKKKITITLDKNIVSVTNDGTTISKKNLEKVFDRFYQTDKSKSGSGLGLAIAKAICDQNNWTLRANSTKRTTTFTLTLSK